MTGPNTLPLQDLAWHARAACAEHPDPDVFHQAPPGDQGGRHVRDTIGRWCPPCPVRAECLTAVLALPRGERRGVAGGVWWRGCARPSDPHLLLPDDVADQVRAL